MCLQLHAKVRIPPQTLYTYILRHPPKSEKMLENRWKMRSTAQNLSVNVCLMVLPDFPRKHCFTFFQKMFLRFSIFRGSLWYLVKKGWFSRNFWNKNRKKYFVGKIMYNTQNQVYWPILSYRTFFTSPFRQIFHFSKHPNLNLLALVGWPSKKKKQNQWQTQQNWLARWKLVSRYTFVCNIWFWAANFFFDFSRKISWKKLYF